MALPFFRALDPTSENSGVTVAPGRFIYSYGYKNEIEDVTLSKTIMDALQDDLNFWEGLETTFSIISGVHYYQPASKNYESYGDKRGNKGVLDFLIFPLVARKLIADTYLSERESSHFINCLSFGIAILLELARLTLAFALTLILIPIVAFFHLFIKPFISYSKPTGPDYLWSNSNNGEIESDCMPAIIESTFKGILLSLLINAIIGSSKDVSSYGCCC